LFQISDFVLRIYAVDMARNCPKPAGEVNLGVVSLAAAPGWSFFPMEDRVVGRPASGVGGIQVVRVPIERAPWPASHELCMAAAAQAAGMDVQGPGADRAKEHNEYCMAGGESFQVGEDFVRIWYRHCPDGMIAAWFAVKAARAGEKSVRDSISECDGMVATVRVVGPVV